MSQTVGKERCSLPGAIAGYRGFRRELTTRPECPLASLGGNVPSTVKISFGPWFLRLQLRRRLRIGRGTAEDALSWIVKPRLERSRGEDLRDARLSRRTVRVVRREQSHAVEMGKFGKGRKGLASQQLSAKAQAANRRCPGQRARGRLPAQAFNSISISTVSKMRKQDRWQQSGSRLDSKLRRRL